jgi:hypothetical protein
VRTAQKRHIAACLRANGPAAACGAAAIETGIGEAYFVDMRRKPRLLRNLICALVAAAFAVAAQPGAMAMPTPHPTAMANAAHATPACDQMHHQKEKGAPCKGMTLCLGMLSCFGMAALAPDYPVLLKAAGHRPAQDLDIAAPGLTHPPESRPPIA